MLYDGRHKAMDEDFKDELIVLIEHLLSFKNLVHKKVNKHSYEGIEFLNYLEDLFRIFQQNDLPKVETIFEMTVDRQMTKLVNLCLENYKTSIKNDQNAVTNSSMIKILHDKCEAQALLMYNESNKMGNSNHETKYKEILKNAVNKELNNWKREKEGFFRGIEILRLQEVRIKEEEINKIRADKKAAQDRLEKERQRKIEILEKERILKEQELKKERQKVTKMQNELEKVRKTERNNNQKKLKQLRHESKIEKNKLKLQIQKVTYFKCHSCCDIVIEYSDLHRFSSSTHEFKVHHPVIDTLCIYHFCVLLLSCLFQFLCFIIRFIKNII